MTALLMHLNGQSAYLVGSSFSIFELKCSPIYTHTLLRAKE